MGSSLFHKATEKVSMDYFKLYEDVKWDGSKVQISENLYLTVKDGQLYLYDGSSYIKQYTSLVSRRYAATKKALELYLSSKWDGAPRTIDSYNFSIDDTGELYINGIATNTWPDYPTNTYLGSSNNGIYIPGHGIYKMVNNHRLKLFSRGTEVPLKGEALSFNELNLSLLHINDIQLMVDKVSNKLFMLVYVEPKSSHHASFSYEDFKELCTKDYIKALNQSGVYLYVLSDYDSSVPTFIGKIFDYCFDDDALYIVDENCNIKRYEQHNGKFSFVKTNTNHFEINVHGSYYSILDYYSSLKTSIG